MEIGLQCQIYLKERRNVSEADATAGLLDR
jgi:hypothetical protein